MKTTKEPLILAHDMVAIFEAKNREDEAQLRRYARHVKRQNRKAMWYRVKQAFF